MKMSDLNELVDAATKLKVEVMMIELFEDDYKQLYEEHVDWTKRPLAERIKNPQQADIIICATDFGPLIIKKAIREKKH